MRGVVREQRVTVLRELEEPVLLLDPVGLRLVDRAIFVDEILFLLEALAADAIPALVRALEQVVGILLPHRVEDRAHAGVMTLLRRADEIVERDVQRLPPFAELRLHPVAPRERREPFLLRAFRDVQRVLVVPHQEPDVEAGEPLVARDHVRGDLFVGGSEVRRRVDVVDRGRDVETLGHQVLALGACGGGISRFTASPENDSTVPSCSSTRTRRSRISTDNTRPEPFGVETLLPTLGRPSLFCR